MSKGPDSHWLATILIAAAVPALGAGLIVMARLYAWALDQEDWTSVTPGVAPWTPALTFLAGAATAIFAEPIRRWIFRPALTVSFGPGCVIKTPTEFIDKSTGKKTESEGKWLRVLVRTSRLAKGCRAHLIKVEEEKQGIFQPSIFRDTVRLEWSSKPEDEVYKPMDIPSDVAQFVNVLATDRSTPRTYRLKAPLPFYYRDLFDEQPKTLRFTILVSSDDAKSDQTSVIFRWQGAWDTFEACPG
jgi:hypothetical protein